MKWHSTVLSVAMMNHDRVHEGFELSLNIDTGRLDKGMMRPMRHCPKNLGLKT